MNAAEDATVGKPKKKGEFISFALAQVPRLGQTSDNILILDYKLNLEILRRIFLIKLNILQFTWLGSAYPRNLLMASVCLGGI